MDANIILSGRGPNTFNAFRAGADAAQTQLGYNNQNALAQTLRTQGPGIMAGDPNALNALARFDPQAALGVQATRQDMAFSAEAMAMKRQEAAQQTAAALAAQQGQIDANALAAEAATLERLITGAAAMYARGDKAGYDAWIVQNGGDPAAMPFEQFPAIAAQSQGAMDAIKQFTPAPLPEVVPLSPEGKAAWDAQRGFLTDQQAAAAMAPSGPLVTVNTGAIPAGDQKINYDPRAASTVTESIDAILADPNLDRIIGPIEGAGGNNVDDLNVAQRMYYGGEGLGLIQKIAQLQSTTWLAARDMLKGAGQITDYESKKADAAMARLSRAQSEKDFRAALKDLRDAVAEGMAKIEAAQGGGATTGGGQSETDIDALLKKYGAP